MITREATYKKAFELKKKIADEKKARRNIMLAAAYQSQPRIKEIELCQTALGTKLAICAISGKTDEIAVLKSQSAALTEEKNKLLKKSGVEDIVPDCPICNDTGYVGGKICDCIKKAAIGIMTEEMSASMPLDDCRFDNFELRYYRDKENADKSNPRRRMTAVLAFCKNYAESFSYKTSENLLFMGKAGLGKTHLTLAIISEVINKGYMPVYGSAENIFSSVEKEKFSGENKGSYDTLLNCDLLVIDDLGAEMVTVFTRSVLYNLINTRLMTKKPTIINTNLSIKEIEKTYDSRISSRLIGNYTAKMFLGNDIRQLKVIEAANKAVLSKE